MPYLTYSTYILRQAFSVNQMHWYWQLQHVAAVATTTIPAALWTEQSGLATMDVIDDVLTCERIVRYGTAVASAGVTDVAGVVRSWSIGTLSSRCCRRPLSSSSWLLWNSAICWWQSCRHLGLFSAKDSQLDAGISHVLRFIWKNLCSVSAGLLVYYYCYNYHRHYRHYCCCCFPLVFNLASFPSYTDY